MTIPRRKLIDDLRKEYRKRRTEIRKRLAEFEGLHSGDDKKIFREMCFCILTANANALSCDRAIRELDDTGILFSGDRRRIRPKLKGRVRFHNKKADFIIRARNIFKCSDGIDVKGKLNFRDAVLARDWLVEHIKGYGYKEASHFLRNIGLGSDIAILDRHILKNLVKYGVIERVPPSLGSRRIYLYIEERMRRFSKEVRIPMDEMDFLFWSLQTGFVFK